MEVDVIHSNNEIINYKYTIHNIFRLIKNIKENKKKIFNNVKIDENKVNDILSSILTFLLYNNKKLNNNIKIEYYITDKRLIINGKLAPFNKINNYLKIFKIIIMELINEYIKLIPFWNNESQNISNMIWLPNEKEKNIIKHNNITITTINNENVQNIDILNKYNINQVDINKIKKNIEKVKEDNIIINNKKIEKYIENGKTRKPTTLINENKVLYEDEIMRSRHIRIYPNKEQTSLFKQWFGITRTIYNKAIYNSRNIDIDKKTNLFNFQNLRNTYVTYNSKTNGKNENIKEYELYVPKDVRAETLRDLTKAFKITYDNYKNNKIYHFKMNYRKKKEDQSIVIPSSAIKYVFEKDKKNKNKNNNPKRHNLYIYNTYIKDNIRYCKKDFNKNKKYFLSNNKFIYDTRIIKKNNKYYLNVCFKLKKINNDVSNNIVSLDPGFRTFQTAYSNNKIIEYNIDKEKISNIVKRIDNLNRLSSKNSGHNCKTRNNFKRIIKRLEERKKNIMKDNHYSIINNLIKDYDSIILPNFENQEIQKKIQNKKVRREINIYSHYTFKCRMKDKLDLYFNKQLITTTEEYTSKTCTNCGNIDNDLGAKKLYKCNKCNMVLDRDYNGARNIFIKTFL
jgi:transposase